MTKKMAKCPRCGSPKLEIQLGYVPDYVRKGSLGEEAVLYYPERFSCRDCGHKW